MKLDLLITELNTGGAEGALTQLAIGLKKRQHQVRVLSIGSEPVGTRAGLVERLSDEGVPVRFGGMDHSSQFLSAARWLGNEFRVQRPDLCQSFLFHANVLGKWAAGQARVPRFVGGLRVAEPNVGREWFERWAGRRMDHVVAVSEQVRAYAIKRLGLQEDDCSVIPNAVDVERFETAPPQDWEVCGWPADSRVILFVGRFHPQKGLELLQQGAAELLGGDETRRILLIGEGPLEDSLRSWASERGDGRIQVLPWQRQIERYLKAASVVVLPSHYEGMPNVILEAMAAGRPVVCSLVEGSAELLGDQTQTAERIAPDRRSRQGFEPGDAGGMVSRLDAILAQPELARALGKSNSDHVREHFSVDLMVERYSSLYGQLIGS